MTQSFFANIVKSALKTNELEDKSLFSFRGLGPLTRSFSPGPHWKHCPQTPYWLALPRSP